MKKMAILTITPDVIRKVLHIPDEAIITGIRVPFTNTGILEIKVEGAGWDTPEGGAVVTAPPGKITIESDGTYTIDWKLPN